MSARKLVSAACIAVCLVEGVQIASAGDINDEIQRRDLALIQDQLQQIQLVVDRIENRQNAGGNQKQMRMFLDVPRLRSDIQEISAGIDSYLSPSRMPARSLSPLEGDYIGHNEP